MNTTNHLPENTNHALLPDQTEDDNRGLRMSSNMASNNNNNNTMMNDILLPLNLGKNTDSAEYLRRELYDRMQKEQDLFDWLQRAALDGIWYWDLTNPEVEWLSPEFKSLFGYTDDEVPNTSAWWQDNIFPEDKALVLQAFHDHVEKGTPYDQVVRYRHKNGETVWVRCRGKADLGKDGKPVRMLGAHSDVTSLMVDLKRKEAVLDLLCTNALDGFWDWNIITGQEFLSARWKKSLGYEEDEVENTRDALLHPDDMEKNIKAVRRHMEDGAPYSVVLRYKRKNGTWAHMLSQGVAQKDENGNKWTRMFGTHTDVSDLEQARTEARQADAAKTAFLTTMSHEIRTPLNAVLGMAQVLLTTELTTEQHECLTTLHNSGAHLLSLLNDVLDISRIEAGHIYLSEESFNIQKTARDVLDIMAQEAKTKNLAISFETHLPAGAEFTGDSERVRQVIFNLIGNAIKFTSEGRVGLRLLTEQRQDKVGVLIQVYDTGAGMDEEQQKLVFQEFQQVHAELAKKYGGSGLGLSISKKLVHIMGGTLVCTSAVHVGTTFDVWLPGLVIPVLQQQQENAVANAEVILFDARPSEQATVAVGLEAAGRKIISCSVIDQLQHVFNPEVHQAIVVVRENLPYEVDEYILNLLQQPAPHEHQRQLRIVSLGKGFSLIPSSDRVIELSQFPTSDELAAALADEPEPIGRCGSMTLDTQLGSKNVGVLLVEDNMINQKVMKKMFSRFPWKINLTIANNGLEAVNIVSRSEFDIIFMDVIMPVMDGLEAAEAIRTTNTVTPIIALTADACTSTRDLCFKAGMNKFLTKPVVMDKVIAEIEEFCFNDSSL